MRLTQRFSLAALTVVMGGASMMAPSAAQADRDGRKNAALALGAVSLALLATQRDKTPGILAGIGAAVAYSSYASSRDRYRHSNYDDCYDTSNYYRDDRPRVNYYVRERYDRYDDNRYDRRDWDRRDSDRHDRDDWDRRDRDNHHDYRQDHHDGDHYGGHHRR